MAQISDKRKQSLYFPEDMLREIQDEATRQDRSLSWIMQRAWSAARATIRQLPGLNALGPDAPAGEKRPGQELAEQPGPVDGRHVRP